jgi:NAD(P)H-hydrate epimerase
LPRRAADAHKWKRAVYVVGGSAGMIGAPVMASTGALRSGAGMVWCGLVGASPPAIAHEIVFVALDSAAWAAQVGAQAARFGALVVGCGLGRSDAAATGVRRLVAEATTPMVIDGDALRHLGVSPRLRRDIVLTPHDGEFEALTGARPAADRFAAVRALASTTGATVVLKGPLTIVADPDGRCYGANRGDQRLATAGTGDVLAGIVGSLLAAGLAPLEAGAVGAWLHGDAGRNGPSIGMVAGDLFAGLLESQSRLSPQNNGGGPDASN